MFTGQIVFDSSPAAVVREPYAIRVRGSGTLTVTLTWAVTSPAGTVASDRRPRLLVCYVPPGRGPVQVSIRCPNEPTAFPPLTFSTPVDEGQYSVFLRWEPPDCVECTIDYTLTVTHP